MLSSLLNILRFTLEELKMLEMTSWSVWYTLPLFGKKATISFLMEPVDT